MTTITEAAAAIAKDAARDQQRSAWAEFVSELRVQLGYVPEWAKRRSQEVEYRIASEVA